MSNIKSTTIPEALLKLKKQLEEGGNASSVDAASTVVNKSEAGNNKKSNVKNSAFEKTEIGKEVAVEKVPEKMQKAIPMMKNERVVAALQWLYETFPHAFKIKIEKPIRVGIISDLLAATEEIRLRGGEGVEMIPTKTALRDAVGVYTRRISYLRKVITQDFRIDLTGQDTDAITEEQKAFASEIVKKRNAQKYGKGKKNFKRNVFDKKTNVQGDHSQEVIPTL